jgi:hypothetical protein
MNWSIDRKILAFVHIYKAAGTTLTHILRLNFFLTHLDVRVLHKESRGIFQSADMKKIMIINPFVRCIAGHDIKPFGDLSDIFPGVRYITLLRDPIKRTISQYQYNVETHGFNLSFDEYLGMPWDMNTQTRWIAGSDDIDLAKKNIIRRFFLVGIVEEFDEFLILLKKKLEPLKFRPGYRPQNVAKDKSPIRTDINRHFDKYREKIIKHNLLDIELYNYVKDEILPKEKKEYGSTFELDVEQFKKLEKRYASNLLRYLDYFYRKCYYMPILKLIRKVNGIG